MTTIASHLRRLVTAAAVTAVTAAAFVAVGPAPTASALAAVKAPVGPYCDASRAQLRVEAPRAYASTGSEHVVWISQIQRYNSASGKWYVYSTFQNWATVTTTGASLTSWSAANTVRGGMYVNNYMRYPVSHVGYYRILSLVQGTKGGVDWSGYISNGHYCYMS